MLEDNKSYEKIKQWKGDYKFWGKEVVRPDLTGHI